MLAGDYLLVQMFHHHPGNNLEKRKNLKTAIKHRVRYLYVESIRRDGQLVRAVLTSNFPSYNNEKFVVRKKSFNKQENIFSN